MLYKKKGLPQEGELVLCTVTKMYPTSVFCKLDHYDDTVGVLHISEVAPGRIRNLSEYVSMGKTLVVQVLRVNTDRGHVDLSLRRASEMRRAKKLSEIKQEKKAEKIIENLAEELKLKPQEIYDKVAPNVFATYDYLHAYFMDIVKGDADISLMKLPKKQADLCKQMVTQRIRPPVMEISGKFKIKSYAGNGVDTVRDIVQGAQKISTSLSIAYGGGGVYPFIIRCDTFEEAEGILRDTSRFIETAVHKDKMMQFTFERQEGKQVEL